MKSNSFFDALGRSWPDTTRRAPAGARLSTQQVCPRWLDLCWFDPQRDLWVYLSTLPAQTNKPKDSE